MIFSQLIVEVKDSFRTYILNKPFYFNIDNFEGWIPEGFRTNFTSFWFMPTGKWTKPSVLHDWLYATKEISRRKSDSIYLKALLRQNVCPALAYIMWMIVRVL